MANCVYFMNHDENTPATIDESERFCLLESKYQVPILWMAMFDRDDLTTIAIPHEDQDGKESIEQIPTLLAPTDKALKTYEKRRKNLHAALKPEWKQYLMEWESFLSNHLSCSHIQVDLSELCDMYDSFALFEQQLRIWLSGIEKVSGPNWDSLCAQTQLNDETVCYAIRGYAYGIELEWKDPPKTDKHHQGADIEVVLFTLGRSSWWKRKPIYGININGMDIGHPYKLIEAVELPGDFNNIETTPSIEWRGLHVPLINPCHWKGFTVGDFKPTVALVFDSLGRKHGLPVEALHSMVRFNAKKLRPAPTKLNTQSNGLIASEFEIKDGTVIFLRVDKLL